MKSSKNLKIKDIKKGYSKSIAMLKDNRLSKKNRVIKILIIEKNLNKSKAKYKKNYDQRIPMRN